MTGIQKWKKNLDFGINFSILGLDSENAEADGDEEISKLLLPKRIKIEANSDTLEPSNDGKLHD